MKFDIETEKERKSRKSQQEKNKIYIILILFFALLSIILIISFVSSNQNQQATIEDPTPSAQPSEKPSSSPETKTKEKISIVDEDSNERPVAVMIDNYIGDARHAGLQDSYLNYEMLVEGGITRIMAIYKDKNPSLIGPVRSARHYFLDYAAESDAIYAHYGWSPYTKNDIEKLGIDNIDGLVNPEVYRRDTNSEAPHNVFTRMSYIRKHIEDSSIKQTTSKWKLLNYSTEEVDLNETEYVPKSADKIIIQYSNNEYRTYSYNESKKYYLRYNNGSPQEDRKTKKQLHFKNIIIQRVPSKVIDDEGRLEITTKGEGRAYYITNGYFLPINWSKKSRTSKTKFTYANGETVEFNDGNTFIQIVPEDCNISIE